MPANSSVEISVSGQYPELSSTTATVDVEAAAGDTDSDLTSNRASQQTSTPIYYGVTLAVTQDKTELVDGDTQRYVIRLENTGNVPESVGLGPYVSSLGLDIARTVRVVCSLNTNGLPCPMWADGTLVTNTQGGQWMLPGHNVVLPPGSVLELEYSIQISIPCDYSGAGKSSIDFDVSATNRHILDKPRLFSTFDYTQCPPRLRITKTQDTDPVANGGTRTYTIVAENISSENLTNVTLMDEYSANAVDAIQDAYERTWNVTCGSETGGAQCPTWATGQTWQYQEDANRSIFLPRRGCLMTRQCHMVSAKSLIFQHTLL